MGEPTANDVANAVIDLHQPKMHGPSGSNLYRVATDELWCTGCSRQWPCATVRVIQSALGDD